MINLVPELKLEKEVEVSLQFHQPHAPIISQETTAKTGTTTSSKPTKWWIGGSVVGGIVVIGVGLYLIFK